MCPDCPASNVGAARKGGKLTLNKRLARAIQEFSLAVSSPMLLPHVTFPSRLCWTMAVNARDSLLFGCVCCSCLGT